MAQETKQPQMPDSESRVFSFQYRASQDESTDKKKKTVEMYAAMFGKRSVDLGGFTEVIMEGAFTDALNTSDVRCLFNHDSNFVLARNTSKTLEIKEDATGLFCKFDLPETSIGRDLAEMMERGDVSQCSFAFRVEEDKWEYIKGAGDGGEGFWVRTISKVKALYDVSIVTYPAYPDTTVSMRSMPKPEKSQQEEKADTGWHDYINAVRSTL